MNKNPYDILGIPRTASEAEVKRAYRELVKKYHPDKYKDNPLEDLAKEKLQEINQAYDSIMSANKNNTNSQYYQQGTQGGPQDPFSSQGKQNTYYWGNGYRNNPNDSSGQYRGSSSCCSSSGPCDICSILCCADCCCECMGGDLIACC